MRLNLGCHFGNHFTLIVTRQDPIMFLGPSPDGDTREVGHVLSLIWIGQYASTAMALVMASTVVVDEVVEVVDAELLGYLDFLVGDGAQAAVFHADHDDRA